ncbi:MAG TPA: hypothetical protein VFV33_13760 [Gemmatimonadaceae bacterium]|nr:hypothetical protein [Gemmatimonadaceae bacterium]
MSLLARGIAVWIVIAVVEMLHGIVRTAVLRPRVGDLASRQIGVLTGSLLILGVAWLSVPWIRIGSSGEALQVGGAWFVLMLAFEVILGRAFGMSWSRIAEDYDPRRGGFMVLGMLVITLAPLMMWELRGRP